MDNELEKIKNKIFIITLGRLYEFNQDLWAYWDEEDYYSPSDFILTLTPKEYKILDEYRKKIWNK